MTAAMGACSTIAELIQAYVDGQLSPDDQSIVEMHIAECPDCALHLSELHDLTTVMIEGFAPKRVSTTFIDRVVSTLPHMYEHQASDALAELNKRVKSQQRLHRLAQLPPYAAMVLLAVASLLLLAVWPRAPLGVVAKVTNHVEVSRPGRGVQPRLVSIGDSIEAGDILKADAESRLILALATAELKLNAGSILRVVHEREVELVKGELFADVESAGSLFRVKFSGGDVTVFGTRFVVQALEDKTVVTVAEGNVLFKSGAGYAEVSAGAQSVSRAGGIPTRAQPVEVDAITQWADEFVVTAEDREAVHRRGVRFPLKRYAQLPCIHGQAVPAQPLGFYDVPSDPFIVRYIVIKRNAFGSAPHLPARSRFAIHVQDARWNKLATVEESYSVFDGTDRDVVLPLPNPVTLDGTFFHVTFDPQVGAGLPPDALATIGAHTPYIGDYLSVSSGSSTMEGQTHESPSS